MPMLANVKHEKFAQEIAKGCGIGEAYVNAGYSAKDIYSACASANKLLKDPKVLARVTELRQRGVAAAEVTIAKVMTELAKLGFSNMLDYMSVQADGSAYVDLSKLTREQAAAVQEVTSEEYLDGRGEDARVVRKTRFKLADKRAALVDLGKHLGAFVDRQEVGAPGDFSRMTDDELKKELVETMRGLSQAELMAKEHKTRGAAPGSKAVN